MLQSSFYYNLTPAKLAAEKPSETGLLQQNYAVVSSTLNVFWAEL